MSLTNATPTSVHVVQDLLQGESILYSVFPVHGYDEIVSHTEKGMQDDSEVSAIYLVRSQFIIQELLCCCVPYLVALHFYTMFTDITDITPLPLFQQSPVSRRPM